MCIEDETARQMAAFLFCLAAIELYEYFEPYKLESDQTLSLLAQWMLLFMFVTALAEKVHVWDGARCPLPAARCPLPAARCGLLKYISQATNVILPPPPPLSSAADSA